MKMKLNLEIDSKRIIPWVIVSVLCGLLVWTLKVDSGEPTIVEKRTTDTIVVTKIDTITITKVETEIKPIHDTTYVVYNDTIYVPVPRKEYTFSEKDMFDFRVKGFDVEFLSAEVYPKTVYTTINDEKTIEITKYKSSLFVFGGLERICGDFSPNIGISLSLRGKWLIGAKIGIFNKEPIYGLHVGYDVLKK